MDQFVFFSSWNNNRLSSFSASMRNGEESPRPPHLRDCDALTEA